ncbi:MAG TPA: polysaccharide pyruvyl transferase family protein [Streptosporangiaceae bacterium]|nr:polysaccharide pyruvyl transferase family protein [Streptosporangiaceae bacterium]
MTAAGAGPQAGTHVLVTGWPSFLHGEATAGDVLSMEAVRAALVSAGIGCELAWSPVFRPDGPALDDADPSRFSHLVFTCGPLHGVQIEQLHLRYGSCTRIAVGVSVIDPGDPAVTGFHIVIPRDAAHLAPRRDLAALSPVRQVPVAGVVLAGAQPEYGRAGWHAKVTGDLVAWLGGLNCGRVPLDTRLDARDWQHHATPGQLESIIGRLDVVVTTRLHGLVLALKNGVPALAVDPVAGGAKVAAQARAWGWPALTAPVPLDPRQLDALWEWSLSADALARAASVRSGRQSPTLSESLLTALRGELVGRLPG